MAKSSRVLAKKWPLRMNAAREAFFSLLVLLFIFGVCEGVRVAVYVLSWIIDHGLGVLVENKKKRVCALWAVVCLPREG